METEEINDAAEQVEAEPQYEPEAIRAEVDATELGNYEPADDGERLLCRYVRLRQLRQMELSRIKDQMQAMVRSLQSQINGLDYVFQQQAAEIVKAKLGNGKARSIKTPWGTLGFRKQAAKLEIIDEQALIDAACGTGLAVCLKTVFSVNKSMLNDWVKKTGEIPTGCEFVPERDVFYVK